MIFLGADTRHLWNHLSASATGGYRNNAAQYDIIIAYIHAATKEEYEL